MEKSGRPYAVETLFNKRAASWSRKFDRGGPLEKRRHELLMAVTSSVVPGGWVLDLGCGSGEIALAMSKAGYRVVGCDISQRMLAFAVGRHAVGVSFLRVSPKWRVLPFGRDKFSGVMLSSVLEYVEEPSFVLQEAFEIMEPGGQVIATVPNCRHPLRSLETIVRALLRPKVSVPGMEIRATRLGRWFEYLAVTRRARETAEWARLFSEAGFERVSSDCESLGALAVVRASKPALGKELRIRSEGRLGRV